MSNESGGGLRCICRRSETGDAWLRLGGVDVWAGAGLSQPLAARCDSRRRYRVVRRGGRVGAIVHNGVLDAGTHLVSKPFTVAQLGAELDATLADKSGA